MVPSPTWKNSTDHPSNISAPFAGYLVKIVSTRLLMVMVGSLILLLSARTLLKMAGLV